MLAQEKATKWYSEGEIDGLTTNGILIMHPLDGFAGNSKPGIWREVSVDGGIYALRESRSTPQKSSLVCLAACCAFCCAHCIAAAVLIVIVTTVPTMNLR